MSTSPAKVRLAQLYALRAQLDALIVAEEAQIDAEKPSGCQHPAEMRRDTSNLKGHQWKCLACGETFEGLL